MNEPGPEIPAGADRREAAVQLLLPLFFLSGATGLVYQTLWSRELHLVFGTSSFAIATVLSAFMAGLALGGWALAPLADRTPRPLRWYGGLEIAIGVYAVAFPTLLQAITPLYLGVWRGSDPGPVAFGAVQAVMVGVLLAPPTAMMGGTLPLLARFATTRLASAGDRVALLYAVNTAGAVFGTWLAGFVLLPAWGLQMTTLAAGGANVALGLAAFALDAATPSSGKTAPDIAVDADAAVPAAFGPVAIAMALAGFASLVYEVAWTRLMALMIGASVYAFSTMLLAFLVGIALGGRAGGPWADRVMRKEGVGGVLRLLAAIEIGVALTSFGLMYVYPQMPLWYVWMFDAIAVQELPGWTWIVSILLSAVVMTPPALLMGAAFPVAVRAVVGAGGALGKPVGRIYAANTAGGVFGAFLAGFVFLPELWVQGTVFLAAAVNLVAALILLRAAGPAASRAWPLGVAVAVAALAGIARRPPWDPMWMTAGMYHYVSHFDNHTREGIRSYAVGKYDLVFYEEGLASVVTVAQNKGTGNMWLANNGKVDASTSTDMPTQVLCSLLPMMFVEEPKDVLVIGLASGITAGAASTHPEIQRLDVVELEPAIERAARIFAAWNFDILDDPRLKLIHNDGRNHVVLTPPGTYDVIVSEPSNPWITGVSNLFTREFFALGKERLKPGGVWSQWVQMYGMDPSDLRSLLATFADVYPHVVVYATIDDADLVLVGSNEPLTPDRATAARLFGHADVAEALAAVDMTDPMHIVALSLMARPRVMEMVGDIGLNTDDNMRIEYSAPRNLHLDTQDANLSLLLDWQQVPWEALGGDANHTAQIAEAYQSRGDVTRAVDAMIAAIQAVPSDDPRRAAWSESVLDWQSELEREAAAAGEGE